MDISRIMQKDYLEIDPYTKVTTIYDHLQKKEFVVVVDDEGVKQVLTLEDVARKNKILVGDCIFPRERVDTNSDIGHVINIMNELNTGYILVQDRGKEVKGVLSKKEIMAHIKDRNHEMEEYLNNQKNRIQEVSSEYETRLKKETHSLIKAKKKAEEDCIAKSEFLAKMSHEIRTPMNGIMGVAQLLRASDLPKSQEEYVSLLEQCASNLLRLVNDILDLSKIEAKKMELVHEKLDLREVIKYVIDMNTISAKKRGTALLSEIDENIPLNLIGDTLRINQVITNLITNAIKFTNDGEVKIKVSIKEFISNFVNIDFEISDTGAGIPEDKIQYLFCQYSQVSKNTLERNGTGLGLVISKQLIELMGGEICVKSEVGKGTSFFFNLILPIEVDDAISIEFASCGLEK